MWHKFLLSSILYKLPEVNSDDWGHNAGVWSLSERDNMKAMVGVLPSGKIVDDFTSPECEPYFLLTANNNFDIVTDGEKYACVYNKMRNANCHFAGEECKLVEEINRAFTTRDALIIKALIKAYVEAPNVA